MAQAAFSPTTSSPSLAGSTNNDGTPESFHEESGLGGGTELDDFYPIDAKVFDDESIADTVESSSCHERTEIMTADQERECRLHSGQVQ